MVEVVLKIPSVPTLESVEGRGAHGVCLCREGDCHRDL